MHFKLLNFTRKLFFDAAKKDTPCSGKFIFAIFLCLFHIISVPKQSIFMNGFCEIESRFKIVHYFLYTLYVIYK